MKNLILMNIMTWNEAKMGFFPISHKFSKNLGKYPCFETQFLEYWVIVSVDLEFFFFLELEFQNFFLFLFLFSVPYNSTVQKSSFKIRAFP